MNTTEKSEPKIPQNVLNLIGFIEIQPASDKSGTRRAIVDSLTLNGDVFTLQLSGFQKFVNGKGWTKYDETRELILDLSVGCKVQITGEGGSPKVMAFFEDGTNYFLFNKSDMKAFNMDDTKKSGFVQAIIDGFKKMRELGYCNETEIYTIGVPGRSITSPNGDFVFKTRYVTISRIIEGKKNAIKIYSTDTKEHFTIGTNTQKEAEDAVTWMLEKNIMPDIVSMRMLVIPAKFINF